MAVAAQCCRIQLGRGAADFGFGPLGFGHIGVGIDFVEGLVLGDHGSFGKKLFLENAADLRTDLRLAEG